jgi:hypothetical protein
MNLCQRHFKEYLEDQHLGPDTVAVGDVFTIVAEQSGLSSPCQECAADAGELIYSDKRANGTTLVEEPAPPPRLVSGYKLKYHYANGYTAVVTVKAGSAQEAIDRVDPAYWDDPQMSGFKATQCTWMEE